MCLFYNKLTQQKSVLKKHKEQFNLNDILYSYEDYIKLIYNVFLYSEAKTKVLKEAIKNDYMLLNKKLKYSYFSETYLTNYFIEV